MKTVVKIIFTTTIGAFRLADIPITAEGCPDVHRDLLYLNGLLV